MDLYATPSQAFRLVTLPLMLPGIILGQLRTRRRSARRAATS